MPWLVGITQNCRSNELVFTIPAYAVKYLKMNNSPRLEKFKQQYPKEWAIVEEAVSKVKQEDNPLLVFAKLKDYEKSG